jgi:subtilase family serine protease
MRRLVSIAASAAVVVGMIGPVASGASAGARADLTSSVPKWAAHGARRGDAAAKRQVGLRVYLGLRNAGAAAAEVQALNDPKSASFHHYLTAAQFRAKYAPTSASVASVSAWLRGAGLKVGYVPQNHFYVSATGDVAAAERAFSVHLGEYSVRGKTLRAPDSEPSTPASLAGTVTAVVGLDESAQLLHPNTVVDAASSPSAPPTPGFRNAAPCSAYWNQKQATGVPALAGHPNPLPWAPCGYTPTQLRSAYGVAGAVAGGLDGKGVTVGIVDAFASRTILADARQYAANHDPAHQWTAGQYAEHVPPGIFHVPASNPCDPQGWYGEETLDVEAVHAMAPGAKVIYSGGKSCEDPAIDAALLYLIDTDQVDLVSNSYGNVGEDISRGEVRAFDQITMQAAMQGITLMFSSGDAGDESVNLGEPSADFSAVSPLVTAVGGTSTGIDAGGRDVLERGWLTEIYGLNEHATAWEDGGFLYGAGGGTSRLYAEPAYQRGVVPDRLATRNGGRGRVVPDVALLADPNTGMRIGQTQTFFEGVSYDEYRIGGTSLSSPLFAGFVALGVQLNHTRFGVLNELIYSLPASAFRDVTPGAAIGVVRRNFNNGQNANDGYGSPTIRDFDNESTQTIHTAVGYDDVTGRGVPQGMTFLNALG